MIVPVSVLWLALAAQTAAPLALKATEHPAVLSLDDALARVDERGVALRTARADEEVALAQSRRAFSLLLPRVDVEGSYAFNCQVGVEGDAAGFDCADQTAQFVSDDFLSGQELLFHAVADGTRGQAQQVPDPAQQQALLARADDLDSAGTKIGKTNNDPIVISPAHIATANLTVSVPLLVLPAWAAVENADDAAQFRKRATDEARRLTRIGVTRAWLGAVQRSRIVDTATARLNDARTRRAALEAAEAVGAIAPLIVDGARLEELAAETALVDADAQARTARARLGVLFGADVDFAVDDRGVVDGFIAAGSSVDAEVVAARARDHRFEVEATALQARIAERDGRAAWLGYAPEVRAFAQARGTTNTGGFVDTPLGTSVGVSLRWNLFDGFERQARVDSAAAAGRSANARRDDAINSVTAEARGAAFDVARARAVLAVAERAVVVARDRLAAVELAVSTGARSDVDLSAAAAARAAADVDLVSARVGLAAAVVSVRAAAGDDVN